MELIKKLTSCFTRRTVARDIVGCLVYVRDALDAHVEDCRRENQKIAEKINQLEQKYSAVMEDGQYAYSVKCKLDALLK